MHDATVHVRPSVADDLAAIQAIYAHHVSHGFGSFEEIPATNFDAGIFAWVIPSDVSIGATGSTVMRLNACPT